MPKRMLQGTVVSDKQDKTVVVKVERRFTHPLLKKTVRRSKNYHAHDEANAAKVGQILCENGRRKSHGKARKGSSKFHGRELPVTMLMPDYACVPRCGARGRTA